METQKYIGEALLKDNSVKSLKIILKDDAVTESKIKDGAITTNKLKDGCITKEKLADDVSLGTTTNKDIDTINKNIETIMDELLNPEIEIDKVDGVYEFVHDERTNQMHLRIGYDFNCKEEPIPNNGTFTDVFINRTYTLYYDKPQTYTSRVRYRFNENRFFNINLNQPTYVQVNVSGQCEYRGINVTFPAKLFNFYVVYPSYIGFVIDYDHYKRDLDNKTSFDFNFNLSVLEGKDNLIKEVIDSFDDEYTIEQKDSEHECPICIFLPKNGNIQEPADVYINNEELPLLKADYTYWTVFYTERKFKAGTYTFYIS